METIKIEFSDAVVARHFVDWFCGAGEQEYWEWMRVQEEKEQGDITATEFRFHGVEDETLPRDDPKRYGGFMADGTIRTVCGRLDKEDDR